MTVQNQQMQWYRASKWDNIELEKRAKSDNTKLGKR